MFFFAHFPRRPTARRLWLRSLHRMEIASEQARRRGRLHNANHHQKDEILKERGVRHFWGFWDLYTLGIRDLLNTLSFLIH